MRQEYNLNKEHYRPVFYTDESGNNEAVIMQQQEIKYLLERELHILLQTENAKEVTFFFEQLKTLNDIQSNQTIRLFLARERILDELNVAIIKFNIHSSNNLFILNCDDCDLTRFPGKIIKRNRDYFRSLQWLTLRNNYLQSLPPEIGQLTALERLSLYNNRLQSLPPAFGQLIALQTLDIQFKSPKPAF